MEMLDPGTPAGAVNGYIVKERVGAGGMGTVYRAFDVQLKRHVALKILNTLDPNCLERFVREREITADLDHPNFVRILSVGYVSTREGRRPFYTMPLLRGETLDVMIRRRCQPDEPGERMREEFSLPRLLQLVQQLCLALESAHDRGIIHRDLKPSNIVLGPYGEVYIVDLGLAKFVRQPEDDAGGGREGGGGGSRNDHPTSRVPAGTPSFMAPEQVLDPACVDDRTDIFGLGAILYFILAGHPPLYRDTDGVRAEFKPHGGVPPSNYPLRSSGSARGPGEIEGILAGSAADALVTMLRGILVPPDELASQFRQAVEAGRVDGPILEQIDPALSAICTKALSRNPDHRYPSCRAMWQELQQYLEGRLEMILHREARDLTRTMSRRTLSTALRDFDLAERRLRQRIVQKESVGRLGIEEKLDLFDLLLDKAKILERRGDSDMIIRSVTRTEPVLETALEVILRKFIQLLIAKGVAQSDRKDYPAAKKTLARAIALSRVHQQDDLRASACGAYGVACDGVGHPAALEEGGGALRESIALADRTGEITQAVRSRVWLARHHLLAGGGGEGARAHLEAALRLAGPDSALLSEVHLALGAYHSEQGQTSAAIHHAEISMRYAEEVGARNLARQAHFVLGKAFHGRGDAARRAEHFRQALKSRGPRRTDQEQEIAAFYAKHRLDPAEIGLRLPRETPLRT